GAAPVSRALGVSAPLKLRHLGDLVGEIVAILFVDGEVFAEFQDMVAEAEERFVGAFMLLVIAEEPVRPAMRQPAIRLLVLVGGEAVDRAGLLVLAPLRRIELAVLVERGDEHIAALVVA